MGARQGTDDALNLGGVSLLLEEARTILPADAGQRDDDGARHDRARERAHVRRLRRVSLASG